MRGDVAVSHWADEGEQVRNWARARVGARAWVRVGVGVRVGARVGVRVRVGARVGVRVRVRARVWARVRVRVSGSVGGLGRVPGQTKATRAQSLLAPLARHDIMAAPHAYLRVHG